VDDFLLGAIAMASLVIGAVFLRYAVRTCERLFVFFTAFFWLDGMGRVVQALDGLGDDSASTYLIRLAAFALIIVGVLEKNLRRKGG